MKNVSIGLAALAIALLVGGCASTGDPKDFSVTIGGKTVIHRVYGQSLPDGFLDPDKTRVSFKVTGKEITKEQEEAMAKLEVWCRDAAKHGRPSQATIMLVNALLYGAAGAVGVGGGAVLAFKGAVFEDYATYGGTAGATNGLASGALSSDRVSYLRRCVYIATRDDFREVGVRATQ